MSLLALFRRPAPARATAPVITRQDAAIANAWGLNLTKWLALTDRQRAILRRDVTSAPHQLNGK